MTTPILEFDAWNIVPVMEDGRLITSKNISAWDGVHHMFVDPWAAKFILDNDEAYLIALATGFICDGGTIPKFFRGQINPWGVYAPAFFIHDALYLTHARDRATADWWLLLSCQALSASWYRRNQIYSAVRAAGWLPWRNRTTIELRHWRKYLTIAKI